MKRLIFEMEDGSIESAFYVKPRTNPPCPLEFFEIKIRRRKSTKSTFISSFNSVDYQSHKSYTLNNNNIALSSAYSLPRSSSQRPPPHPPPPVESAVILE